MSTRPAEESFAALQSSLQRGDPSFWSELAAAVERLDTFGHAMKAVALRRKAVARSVPDPASRPRLRLAILGGCSLQPLRDLVELNVWAKASTASSSWVTTTTTCPRSSTRTAP